MAVADPMGFQGRTLAVVNDFQLREQRFLYQKTRELKEAIRRGEPLSGFRLQNADAAVYTIFMEDSTRTKESFRNAAEFHQMKVNMFDCKSSSFQKNETITDTIKMLCGYSSGQSLFVIRSKIEGVCRWLEEAIGEYTQQMGFPRASFINAGDGRHEHPSQELLDEFSFLEHKGWDTSSIHLALLGDLFHGRTVHSKVDGLRLYDSVTVDLIAPSELALPKMYEDRMVSFGFRVRKFASIEEYLGQTEVARIWYFTRLQLERMGDKVLERSTELRKAVTFRKDFLGKVPDDTKFFHPLPRDARHPTLPFWLDNMSFNGWDQQSQNGYFTRIILLGMLAGLFDKDLEPSLRPGQDVSLTRPMTSSLPIPDEEIANVPAPLENLLHGADADFVKEMPSTAMNGKGTYTNPDLLQTPCSHGILIDQIGMGLDVDRIWALMFMVKSVLGRGCRGSMGVCDNAEGRASGYILEIDFEVNRWDRSRVKKLAAMAPGCKLGVMWGGCVRKKFQLHVPPRIYNFSDISCKNKACISHPSSEQHEVDAYFERAASRDLATEQSGKFSWAFTCKYCEHVHSFWQIWDTNYAQGLSSFDDSVSEVPFLWA